MSRKFVYLFTFLVSYAFTATAQMVTDMKVVAVQEYKHLAAQAGGYSGADKEALDFRSGRGGGYVYVLFQNSTDTTKYITKVSVEKRSVFGVQYTDNDGYLFEPASYWQESEKHYDKKWRGGLNGRNYSCYGGDYIGQHHIYVSHTGHNDFSKKVLRRAYVTTSEEKKLGKEQECRGGYAGGGRYLVLEWHTHEPKYKATGSILQHIKYCRKDNCGITTLEDHRFPTMYGNDTWTPLPKSDKLSETRHYKKCIDCKQIVYEDHKWATYSADMKDHTKRCLSCDFVTSAGHANFGKQQLPVDEYFHAIYCDSCQFLKKLHHEYGDDRSVRSEGCESTLVRYTCRQCYHQALFEEAGIGHDYDRYGICRRGNCLHPYERPGVEYTDDGKDSVFVVKTFGNLYWIADYVNNRRPKTNIRLANDLQADGFMRMPWVPIGATDSTAFAGTFDGGGHVITMLQTETPVAGQSARGLFGTIGKEGTVKNVTLTSCNMRGWDYIGAVAGINEGKIEGCQVAFSAMTSIGSGMNLGGICGLNKGTISGCTTASNVWVGGVRDYAGGICGTNAGGTLTGNTTAAICGSGSDAALPEAASQQ